MNFTKFALSKLKEHLKEKKLFGYVIIYNSNNDDFDVRELQSDDVIIKKSELTALKNLIFKNTPNE